MDPDETLWDILVLAQRIGQLNTLQGHLDNLEKIRDLSDTLTNWLKDGGFAPNVGVWILTDKDLEEYTN